MDSAKNQTKMKLNEMEIEVARNKVHRKMPVGSGTSFIFSSVLSILLFSGMQMYRHSLAASPMSTILGGFLASMLFMLILTAIGNVETAMFGKNFQTKLFPEVIFCLVIAVFSASMIHRVCTTTCLVFSLVALHYMNKLSQQVYAVPVVVPAPQGKRKNK